MHEEAPRPVSHEPEPEPHESVREVFLTSDLSEQAKDICRGIVAEEYAKRGYYLDNNPKRAASPDFYDGERGERFAIRDARREIIGTVALVLDESDVPGSLPSGSLFEAEIAQLQHGGTRLAEVGQLATLHSIQLTREAIRTVFDAIMNRARELGAHALVVTVNPRHAKIYQSRLLNFLPLSSAEPKEHAAVNNAPAVALYFPLKIQ